MDQEPEFYVSPEDLEAQMTADERGEGRDALCCCTGERNLTIMSLMEVFLVCFLTAGSCSTLLNNVYKTA